MQSKYFKESEFACKCGCGDSKVHPLLVLVLDDVREHFGVPVTVTSGKRCAKHNAAVGGAKNSQHLLGHAADITVKGVQPSEVHKYLTEKYSGYMGVGKYNGFTHIDIRDGMSRW